MGISTNYYTIYGIKCDYDKSFAESYNEVYDDNDTPFVLIDGMGGDYMIFGVVLFDSGNLRYGDIKDYFVEIEIDSYKEMEYKRQFNAKFPTFSHLMDAPFKLMTLVHYH